MGGAVRRKTAALQRPRHWRHSHKGRRRTVMRAQHLALIAGAALVIGHSAAAQAPAQKMKDCLLIEDGYKERLECYDALIKPEPKPGAKKGKLVGECRFVKEEDERLACFNSFVEPKKQVAKGAPKPKATSAPPAAGRPSQ